MVQTLDLKTFYMDWLRPLAAWLKELTRGETLMLIAALCFGAAGAYGSYLFYEPSRGPIIAAVVATGIELLYLGSAGAAVKYHALRWLAYMLMFLGSAGSAYFGVMVSIKEAMPGMFQSPVVWPSVDQWVVFGIPAIVEGVVPALAALLLSIFLHSSVSHRLIEADDKERQIEVRKQMKPFGCPFCPAAFDSPSKLYGHTPRCDGYKESSLSVDERKAIIAKAVSEGKQRILEG